MTSSVSSALNSINASGMTLLDEILAQKNKENSEILNSQYGALSSQVNSSANSAKNAYSQASLTSDVAQAALKKALAQMQENGEEHITFAKLAAYQKKLEENFSASIRVDLFEQGVPLETDFTLKLSSEGQISVDCNDPGAKAIIEKYLSDNPKACEEFGYIQALANVERARQSTYTIGDTLRDAKAALQASAVEAFMADTLQSGLVNYTDMLASFNGSDGTTTFYSGLSFRV